MSHIKSAHLIFFIKIKTLSKPKIHFEVTLHVALPAVSVMISLEVQKYITYMPNALS